VVKRAGGKSEAELPGMDSLGKGFPAPLVIDTRIALADRREKLPELQLSKAKATFDSLLLAVSKSHFCWSFVGPRDFLDWYSY
jgi:hypothetical protein